MLELQRNVPPPVKRTSRSDRRKKYPFENMQIGHFFFVPGKSKNTIRPYFSDAGKRHGIKLRSDLIYALRNDAGEWEPCSEDAPGATQGVGVWRTE